MSFTHLFKVWTCKIPSLCCYLTYFFFIYAYLQFSTMWILWDRKCEHRFFQITHAKNSSNHSPSTRDLTRFFGICDLEKTHTHISSSQYSLNARIDNCLIQFVPFKTFWITHWFFLEIMVKTSSSCFFGIKLLQKTINSFWQNAYSYPNGNGKNKSSKLLKAS